MKRKRYFQLSDGVRLSVAGLLYVMTEVLKRVFKANAGTLFPKYRELSKAWMKIKADVVSVVPFALWDIFFFLGIIAAVFLFVWIMIKNRKALIWWVTTMLLVVSALHFYGSAVWSYNHYGPSLAQEMGFSKDQFTEDELYRAAFYYTKMAALYAEEVERDETGAIRKEAYPLKQAAKDAGQAFVSLGETYPVFSGGSVKPVKRLTVFDPIMLYTGTSGIFVEFTGEATVPSGNDVVDVPHTMCHEAAHRLGIASEEDANFAAFLACDASDDPYFKYSGYYSAFIYTINKLNEISPGKVQTVYKNCQEDGLSLVFTDSGHAVETYKKYDTPVEKAGQKINDASLKSYDVEEGVRSYGNVVNDLIAWYLLQEK